MKTLFSGKIFTIPNLLSVLRICMIPWLIWTYLARGDNTGAALILLLSGLTDIVDGFIARRFNMVSNLGKALDPLADKLLVMVALISFTFERWIDPVAVVIILAREFMVTGLRLVVANEGIVVAAGIWGKLKTAFTMVAMCIIMFLQILFPELKGAPDLNWVNPVFIINEVLIWISVILTVISGGIYLKAYGKYIDPNE